MAKRGRPKTEISTAEFEKLCALQCTLEEIAGWFKCSVDTIENWCKSEYNQIFSEVYKQKRAAGKISLRRKQWQLADKSAAMAIFLGKNYLGQRDSVDVDASNGKLVELIGGLKNGDVQQKATTANEDVAAGETKAD